MTFTNVAADRIPALSFRNRISGVLYTLGSITGLTELSFDFGVDAEL